MNFQLASHLGIAVNIVTRYKRTLFVIALLMIGESVLSLASPWLAGRFTQSLLQDSPSFSLSYRQILALWVVVLAVQGLSRFYNTFLMGNTSEKILSKMRIRI